MRKSVIIVDKEEFYNTGDIVAIKFKVKSPKILDNSKLKEFKEILFGHIHGSSIFNDVDKLLKHQYNEIRTISNHLLFLNAEFEESISIEEIIRVSSHSPIEGVKYDLYNTNDGIAKIVYISNKFKASEEKLRPKESDINILMSKILKKIYNNRPLCIKESDLLPEIYEAEQKNMNHYLNGFLQKAVLAEQEIDGKPIKEWLDKYRINIIDFNYIV